MTDKLDSPLFAWVAYPGQELISLNGLILMVIRPDGTKLMQFHLRPGIYRSIFVNHPNRIFHYDDHDA